jgi:hypothetical protein
LAPANYWPGKLLAPANYRHIQNIGAGKNLGSTNYWRHQNSCIDKILASTKCWRRQNLGVDKILSSTKSWLRQNTCVDKILASTKYLCRQNLGAGAEESLLFGSAESTAADFSQTSLKISFFLLMVLFSPHVVAKCGVVSARSTFMGGLSPLLYRLIVPARHAENVKKTGPT